MYTILEAFANGTLRIEADVSQRSPEHQKICDLAGELEQNLSKQLSDDENELLRQLLDALASESSHYAENRFIRGYQLGTLMTMEIFTN